MANETKTLLTPLSIVMAFIGVIEATLAYTVSDLQGDPQLIFVWFMVLFPLLVLGGFFYVQVTDPVSWYPPSEIAKAKPEQLDYLAAGRAQKTQEVSERVRVLTEELERVQSVDEVKEIVPKLEQVHVGLMQQASKDRILDWLASGTENFDDLRTWMELHREFDISSSANFVDDDKYEQARLSAISDLKIP